MINYIVDKSCLANCAIDCLFPQVTIYHKHHHQHILDTCQKLFDFLSELLWKTIQRNKS